MGDHSAIEWTEATWNPTTGCDKTSPGCDNCLAPETGVLGTDMRWRPIGQLAVGDALLGFTEEPALGANRTWQESRVEAVWRTEAPTVRFRLANGRTVEASENHLWLAHPRPWWRRSDRLHMGTRLRVIGDPDLAPDLEDGDYAAGYVAGATEGDGTFRWDPSWRSSTVGYPQSYWRVAVAAPDVAALRRLQRYLARFGVVVNIRPFDGGPGHASMLKIETRTLGDMPVIDGLCRELASKAWKAGWLAGIFDTDGSHDRNLRISQRKDNGVLERVERYGADLGFAFKIERWERASPTVRLTGGADDKIRFLSAVAPALERKCRDLVGRRIDAPLSDVVAVERGPVRELVDITTSTRTFVAEGVLTHNCYALTLSKRLKAMGQAKYQNDGDPRTSGPGFGLTLHPDTLETPRSWTSPRVIFVNSMSDLFHPDVPETYIRHVFEVIADTPQHQYQVLTKRSKRLASLGPKLEWPPNLWMGVSVETSKYRFRLDHLRHVDAAIRFVSAEPLLGPLENLGLDGIHWLIAGGESGPRARPMDGSWVLDLRDQCAAAGVPFFFKQWGGSTPKAGGRTLDGQTHDEMPALIGA